MTDQTEPTRRRSGYTTFPEAPIDEPGVVAILFTKDAAGNIRSYVKEYPGRQAPDPEAVAWLAQSVTLANL